MTVYDVLVKINLYNLKSFDWIDIRSTVDDEIRSWKSAAGLMRCMHYCFKQDVEWYRIRVSRERRTLLITMPVNFYANVYRRYYCNSCRGFSNEKIYVRVKNFSMQDEGKTPPQTTQNIFNPLIIQQSGANSTVITNYGTINIDLSKNI